MAGLTSVSPLRQKERGVSGLENAAAVMKMLQGIGSLYGAFAADPKAVPKSTGDAAAKASQDAFQQEELLRQLATQRRGQKPTFFEQTMSRRAGVSPVKT